jgi:hypothetical protein
LRPLEWRLGQIQAELAEACRKKEAARGAALFSEQCRHHSVLGWTEPRRPNWLDLPRELVQRDDSERELTDDERRQFSQQMQRFANRCNTRIQPNRSRALFNIRNPTSIAHLSLMETPITHHNKNRTAGSKKTRLEHCIRQLNHVA